VICVGGAHCGLHLELLEFISCVVQNAVIQNRRVRSMGTNGSNTHSIYLATAHDIASKRMFNFKSTTNRLWCYHWQTVEADSREGRNNGKSIYNEEARI